MDLRLVYTLGVIVLELTIVWAGTVTFYKEALTWPNAVRFCQKSGGQLVKDAAIEVIPQEQAWVGRRIKDGYIVMVTNGCYNLPSDVNVTTVKIQNESFAKCLKGCLGFEYIGVQRQTCYCLTKETLKRMHSTKFCDFINVRGACHWSSPPNVSCGGVDRMSTYRYTTPGFSLPLQYTDGTHAMLCAKWKGRGNNGGLILTGCEQQLEVVCFDNAAVPAGLSLDWQAALRTCYTKKTDLLTCNSSSCMARIPTSLTEVGFWIGGFGYNIVEYSSDSVDINSASLCGTVSLPGKVLTYLPCGVNRPFLCEFPSDIAMIDGGSIVGPIVGSIVGLVIVAIIVAIGIILARKFKRSRKSTHLDILSRGNDGTQSDINIVKNDYSTIDDSAIAAGEVLPATDGHLGTDYDEISPLNSGDHTSNTTNDNYDHVRNVTSSSNTLQDNYDHMPVPNLTHKPINDNYDHMPKPLSAQTAGGHYDLMQKTNTSDEIIREMS